jgi:hypothetical protein
MADLGGALAFVGRQVPPTAIVIADDLEAIKYPAMAQQNALELVRHCKMVLCGHVFVNCDAVGLSGTNAAQRAAHRFATRISSLITALVMERGSHRRVTLIALGSAATRVCQRVAAALAGGSIPFTTVASRNPVAYHRQVYDRSKRVLEGNRVGEK